jgi:hypothetical protein
VREGGSECEGESEGESEGKRESARQREKASERAIERSTERERESRDCTTRTDTHALASASSRAQRPLLAVVRTLEEHMFKVSLYMPDTAPLSRSRALSPEGRQGCFRKERKHTRQRK